MGGADEPVAGAAAEEESVSRGEKRPRDHIAAGEDATEAGEQKQDPKAEAKRKLEEAKKALLARLQAEAEAEAEAAAAEATYRPPTEVDGGEEQADDCPVADVDIVQFLREESESAAGFCLVDQPISDPGVVACKEAKMQRRDPRRQASTAIAIRGPSQEGGAAAPNLPQGARMASKATGAWSWGGSTGGVAFSRAAQLAEKRAAVAPGPITRQSHPAFFGDMENPVVRSGPGLGAQPGQTVTPSGLDSLNRFVPASSPETGALLTASGVLAAAQAAVAGTAPAAPSATPAAAKLPSTLRASIPPVPAFPAAGTQRASIPPVPAFPAATMAIPQKADNPFGIPSFQSNNLAMAMAAANGRRPPPSAKFVAAPKLGSGQPRPSLTSPGMPA